MKLNQALAGVTKLGFDTPPIIYFIETHPQYDALVTEVFRHIASASLEGFTSVITLSEVLVQPLRRANTGLQQAYRSILIRTRNFRTLPINAMIAEIGADLRARYNLRTPDALQIAVALNAGCEAFLTNDAALQRVTELRVFILDELEL
jgi:predicted nucleic acid-binding protein